MKDIKLMAPDISDDKLLSIWKKGDIVEGYDAQFVRKDACGAWIFFPAYGNPDSPFGWGIDHICPKTKIINKAKVDSEFDNLLNLRPMLLKNIESKGEDYPVYRTAISADDKFNRPTANDAMVMRELQKELAQLFS